MYIYIKIDNICGIDKEIKIDFISEPRKKSNMETVIITKEGKKINKFAGILGCNASGKSSIIKSIIAIDNFISYYSEYGNAKNDNNIYKNRKIEDLMPEPNSNRRNEYSVIELCTYIEDCSKPGIYTYRLEYTLNEKIEIKTKEILKYKTSFNSKERIILDIKKKKLESEIGLKYNYLDSFKQDLIDNKDALNNFEEKLEYYKCFYEYIHYKLNYEYDMENNERWQYYFITKWIKNDEKTLKNVAKLIDSSIVHFELEKRPWGENEKIYFINKNKQKLTFFDMSGGTRKFLTDIYLLLATINSNGMILIDEIENSLHIDLVKFILKLVTIKKSRAQIIFTTNNQYTMDETIMRIDQMYYLEKNEKGETELKRFSDSIRKENKNNNVRNDETIRIKYKKKMICTGFQPSDEKINEFIESIENRNTLKNYIIE